MTDIPTTVAPAAGASTGAGIAARVASSRSRLADNYEAFLSLLTTQLRNQDPLSPMDSNQFTQQIVQMTGVEQQLLTNDLLTALVDQGSGGMADAANYIGRTIVAESGETALNDGAADWVYELGDDASAVTGEIRNGAGVVVWRGALAGKADGENSFRWNGENMAGNALPEGRYTLTVSASDRSGGDVTVRTLVRGQVTGVEQRDTGVYLNTDAGDVPLTAVRSVIQAAARPAVPSFPGV